MSGKTLACTFHALQFWALGCSLIWRKVAILATCNDSLPDPSAIHPLPPAPPAPPRRASCSGSERRLDLFDASTVDLRSAVPPAVQGPFVYWEYQTPQGVPCVSASHSSVLAPLLRPAEYNSLFVN